MPRQREPAKLKEARGKSHMTQQEISDAEQCEIYAQNGEIVKPDWLDEDAGELFDRETAYMARVNAAAGVNIYGDTDAEALAMMCASYSRFLYYKGREERARDAGDRQRYNSMKNKEAATYERLLRVLKLDPSSRVDFTGLKGGADDGKQDAFADI